MLYFKYLLAFQVLYVLISIAFSQQVVNADEETKLNQGKT